MVFGDRLSVGGERGLPLQGPGRLFSLKEDIPSCCSKREPFKAQSNEWKCEITLRLRDIGKENCRMVGDIKSSQVASCWVCEASQFSEGSQEWPSEVVRWAIS